MAKQVSGAGVLSNPHRPTPAFELLECRQLLAAGDPWSPVLGEDGVLRIHGTDAAETVGVSRIIVGDADEIRVNLGKRRHYFATDRIQQIRVDLLAGSDLLDVNQKQHLIHIPIFAAGGAGDDTLFGTMANDSLHGGDGDDSIVGGYGDDLLIGEAGADRMFGGKGNDSLYGNEGNDLLEDDRGDNRMLGGAGRDSLKQSIAQPPEFLIGVWSQPAQAIPFWKARGLNTLVNGELMGGRHTLEYWDAAAQASGMYTIRQPAANPANDANVPNLIAWLQVDEPDYRHIPPEVTQAFYDDLKEVNPNMPVMMNFSGGYVVGYSERFTKHPYEGWVQGADWISNDIYPVGGWSRPNQLALVGHAVDVLKGYAPEKPQFAFIETSDPNVSWLPNGVGVTPAQFTAEIWNAVIHGVRGIVYFPQAFGPYFDYDATPPEVNAEMIKQNARLTALSPVIMSAIEPRGYNVEVPAGFEATWRTYGGKLYLIVLNLKNRANAAAEIKITGAGSATTAEVYGEKRSIAINAGVITDHFEGLAPRVYVVG